MQKWHVPGAVLLLVQGDDVVFSKGYGYADLERHVPVTPQTTVFHVQSVSKLFTATSVMQLVEQGKVNVDGDVNSHLSILRINDPYPQPVTIRDLLTHTAGFDSDQREIGGWAPTATDSDEFQFLDQVLTEFNDHFDPDPPRARRLYSGPTPLPMAISPASPGYTDRLITPTTRFPSCFSCKGTTSPR